MKYNLKSPMDLIDNICQGVYQKSTKVETFLERQGGCLQIQIDAFAPEFIRWWPGMSPDNDGKAQLTYNFKAHPRLHTFNISVGLELIDCCAYAGMKIAACRFNVEQLSIYQSSLRSTTLPGKQMLKAENGYAFEAGAVCVAICEENDRRIAEIYIAVSGATSEEDEACAKAAIPIICKFFEDCDGIYLIYD